MGKKYFYSAFQRKINFDVKVQNMVAGTSIFLQKKEKKMDYKLSSAKMCVYI